MNSTMNEEQSFSKLEATLVTTNVAPRPMSRQANDVYRHAQEYDLNVNELDFNYLADFNCFPLSEICSTQDLLGAVLFSEHMSKAENFSSSTNIDCLSVEGQKGEWLSLNNEAALQDVFDHAGLEMPLQDSKPNRSSHPRKLLAFFVPLIPKPNTSFGNALHMTHGSVKNLFGSLSINPGFLLNLLGRPDYWAPQRRWDTAEDGSIIACDFSCQHPRWNLHVQGAPLSVYMRHDMQRDLTVYVISHKQKDTTINSLREFIGIGLHHHQQSAINNILLNSPLDLHVMIANLSFESSKFHVKRFQRFMWEQFNKVDDHLAGPGMNNRSKLRDLTKELHIISQNADSHIANAEVALFTARGIRGMADHLHSSTSSIAYQRTVDTIEFVIQSMQKQQTWFLNYKGRKDSTMNLVYNLVTQQDAANNISIAVDMKRDSTSMSAIAALTMVFLPATFTSTVLSAGIFSATAGHRGITVSGLWWLWLVITLPLTLVVMLCWYFYQRYQGRTLFFKAQKKGTI